MKVIFLSDRKRVGLLTIVLLKKKTRSKHNLPGTHVLNAAISLYKPRPQTLIPATRNLKAVPG